MLSFFSPSSIFMRLIASDFLPSSASWLVVLFLSWSTLISSRRADIANSARNWSLSAWISAIDSGVAASSRRMVSRTARACTNGMMVSAMRQAARKPTPTYMIGSIMNYASGRRRYPAEQHATRVDGVPVSSNLGLNPIGRKRRSERIPGRLRREFEVADIGAEPHPDTGADRDHHDAVRGQHRHAQPADEIRRAVETAEALVDRLRRRQVVDQHHGAGTFAA